MKGFRSLSLAYSCRKEQVALQAIILQNETRHKTPDPSRKRDKLGIPRPTVGPDAILGEPALRVQPAGLVEAEAAGAHEATDLAFGGGIEAGAGITGGDVGAEIEVVAREAVFEVVGEGGVGEAGRQARVDVVWDREVREPAGARQVEGCGPVDPGG